MRILLDTNVVLDVALGRKPFDATAQNILDASDFHWMHFFITASIATDLYYIIGKSKGPKTALEFLADLFQLVDVCPIDKNILLQALASNFNDFEDAVQNAAAVDNHIDVIVTRNKSDYATSSLTVLSPDEFLAAHLS